MSLVPGVLTAERVGPHIKFEFEYPEGYDYAHAIERFIRMETDKDGKPVEVWEHIHTGTSKHVRGCVAYERAKAKVEYGHDPDDPIDSERVTFEHLNGPRRYRALAYKRITHEEAPHLCPNPEGTLLHTGGAYSYATVV